MEASENKKLKGSDAFDASQRVLVLKKKIISNRIKK